MNERELSEGKTNVHKRVYKKRTTREIKKMCIETGSGSLNMGTARVDWIFV